MSILSIIMSLVLLFSGTGAPAQPETATTLTLSNLTVAYNGESTTLDQSAELSYALGAEEADLHFQINSGDKTLLPVSAKITNDQLSFNLGKSQNVYVLTADTLQEIMNIDESSFAAFEQFMPTLQSYFSMLEQADDPELNAALSAESTKALLAPLTEGESSTVQVNGQDVAVKTYTGEYSFNDIMGMADALLSSQDAKVSAFAQSLLSYANGVMGSESASFTDFFRDSLAQSIDGAAAGTTDAQASVDDEINSIKYPITIVMDETGNRYVSVVMDGIFDGEKLVSMTETVTADDAGAQVDMTMDMFMEEDSTGSMNLKLNLTGPSAAPTAFTGNMTMSVVSTNDYTYEGDVVLKDGYSCTNVNTQTISCDFKGDKVDALNSFSMAFSISNGSDNSYTYVNGDEPTSEHYDGIGANLAFDYAEQNEDDGSVTGTVRFSGETGGETVGLSFDLNRKTGTPVDYFSGMSEIVLPAQPSETTDASSDSSSVTSMDPGYMSLSIDAMSMMADVNTLSADEKIAQLFGSAAAIESDLVDEADAEVDDEYTESTVDVATLEDAAAYFGDNFPQIAIPEGYQPDGITVDESGAYMDAYFAAADGSNFELFLYSNAEYSSVGNAEYFDLGETGMTGIDGSLVTVYRNDDGTPATAEMNLDGYYAYIYFEGIDDAGMQTILQGIAR